MEAAQIEEIKTQPLSQFTETIKNLKDQDLVAALNARPMAELYALAEEESGLPVAIRYNIAKVLHSKMKTTLIDPFKELKKKEDEEEQKKISAQAARRQEFSKELDAIFSQEMRDAMLGLATRYIVTENLGKIIDVGFVAKLNAETNAVELEYSSTLSRARTSAGRPKGSTTSGGAKGGPNKAVTIKGGDAEKNVPVFTEPKQYPSFAEAVRELGLVGADHNWEGFNAKRFLQSKGYECDYIAAEPTATETEGQPAEPQAEPANA